MLTLRLQDNHGMLHRVTAHVPGYALRRTNELSESCRPMAVWSTAVLGLYKVRAYNVSAVCSLPSPAVGVDCFAKDGCSRFNCFYLLPLTAQLASRRRGSVGVDGS